MVHFKRHVRSNIIFAVYTNTRVIPGLTLSQAHRLQARLEERGFWSSIWAY